MLPLDSRGLPQLLDLGVSGLAADGWSVALDNEYQFLAEPELEPKIAGIRLASGAGRSGAAQELAVAHRLLALKHRWHALGEAPVKSAPPYRDIITDEFRMDWGTGAVESFDQLEAWLTHSAGSMAAARHDMAAFQWARSSTDRYEAEFEFNWHGISQAGATLQARSRHVWEVVDHWQEAYARIKRMTVEFLVPFHVVEDHADNPDDANIDED